MLVSDGYLVEKDYDFVIEVLEFKDEQLEVIFKVGQLKRVWGELYKVCCYIFCGFFLNMYMYQ